MVKFKKALLPKKKKKESSVKYYLRVLHLWLGLFSAVIVFTVCLTGAIYVFKNQITDYYNRERVYVEKAETRLSLDYFENLLSSAGQDIISIYIPAKNNRSLIINYADKETGLIKAHHFNPYTGENLGGGSGDLDAFFALVEDIHKTLLLGDFGKQLIGVFTLIFIFLLFSGLILWWPKKKKRAIKNAFRIRTKGSFHRFNRDLHTTLGFYSFLFLLFIAVTGVYITYPWVKSGVMIALGGESVSGKSTENSEDVSDSFTQLMAEMLEKEEEKETADERTSIKADDVLALTEKQLSYNGSVTINYPTEENPRFLIQKINTSNWLGAMLPDLLEFDTKGELKKEDLFKDKPLHRQFQMISKPLHTGELMGIPSLSIYFLAVLIGCSLPVTGFIMWWKKL